MRGSVMSHGDHASNYACPTLQAYPGEFQRARDHEQLVTLTFDLRFSSRGFSAAADSDGDCVRPRGADRETGSRVSTVVDLGNARGRRLVGYTCCCCWCH